MESHNIAALFNKRNRHLSIHMPGGDQSIYLKKLLT